MNKYGLKQRIRNSLITVICMAILAIAGNRLGNQSLGLPEGTDQITRTILGAVALLVGGIVLTAIGYVIVSWATWLITGEWKG